MQDRYFKIVLTLVAVLLAANLVQSFFTNANSVSPAELFLGTANAQSEVVHTRVPIRARNGYELQMLRGFTVKDLSSVVALGDGMTFVATNPEGFMVYQVLPINK